jgi:AraC-like DNA-binding protein
MAVIDTGIGVPDEDRQIIFDDFHQSRRTIARGFGGLGLGLSICRRLVEMHGGEIAVHANDRAGTGSVFVVSLPTLQTDIDDMLRFCNGTVTIVTGEGGYVDAGLLRTLTQNHVVVEQMSIADTIERPIGMSASGTLLMNAAAVAAGGWQVIRQMKENAATRDRPVVLYAFGQAANASARVEYLSKPIGSAELIQVLQRKAGENSRAKTILVVDDDPDLLTMHASMIRNHFSACRVVTAAGGRDALELVRREAPDLILLDLMMPEMSGFDVLRELQGLEMARQVPVIVLTAKSVTREELDRLGRSVTAVLAKGVFTAEETLAHIQQTIDGDRPLAHEAQQLVRRALVYIHEHYGKPITRKNIAHQVHVSEDHLTRSFGRVLNMSPMTYLTRFRISRAKNLLDREEATIADVAAAVGFTSQFHFSDVFKKETGVSPSLYRRRVRTRS